MFAFDSVRASQIALIDRLPDWLCRQIGQIVASTSLHQIGIIARLALIDSRQIEGLPRLSDWQRCQIDFSIILNLPVAIWVQRALHLIRFAIPADAFRGIRT